MSIQIKHHRISPVDATKDRADTVVTVALGHVTGRIVRSQYDAGTISYDAHIELVGGCSPNQIDNPQDLRNLGTVATALADELAAATG
ncbi:hypothetical protein [Mycobacteroides abscessus]|uniref:hypothetical protein n=1 Tax=Mycobacteroides abscessus TaxID=36809 RepID=UPI001E3652EC